MNDAVEDALKQSSALCTCRRCGSTATYRGSPDAINKAMKEFYELHERCYSRTKAESKRCSVSDKDLPTWSDCELAVGGKHATALERFIYDYEPSDAARWRSQLAAVVQEAKNG